MKMRAVRADLARRPRDRLPVVARARRDDAGGALLVVERRDAVVRAADLERPRALEVLRLEPHLAAGKPRERLRAVDRRDARDAVEARARRLDVSERRTPSSSPMWNTFSRISRTARQRVELAALHLVEQPPQLGVVGDRVLECAFARADATANTSPARLRAPALLELPRLARGTRGAPRSSPTARARPRRASPR